MWSSEPGMPYLVHHSAIEITSHLWLQAPDSCKKYSDTIVVGQCSAGAEAKVRTPLNPETQLSGAVHYNAL